jgi:lysine biosynthesis protein LysW
MKNLKCLECANEIELQKKDYRIGDIIECPFCGSELEVVEIEKDGKLVLDIIEEEK